MALKKVYEATLPSVHYIFRNGKPAVFINGKFATDIAAEIAELDEEIALGHPHIKVCNGGEPVEVPDNSDLIAGLRAQVEAQIRAEMAAAVNPENDMGKSDQSAVKPASTADVAQAAAGGNGASLISLANLRATTGLNKSST